MTPHLILFPRLYTFVGALAFYLFGSLKNLIKIIQNHTLLIFATTSIYYISWLYCSFFVNFLVVWFMNSLVLSSTFMASTVGLDFDLVERLDLVDRWDLGEPTFDLDGERCRRSSF